MYDEIFEYSEGKIPVVTFPERVQMIIFYSKDHINNYSLHYSAIKIIMQIAGQNSIIPLKPALILNLPLFRKIFFNCQ